LILLPSSTCSSFGFTKRCQLHLSNKRLRSVTSADWNELSVTDRTRDGINEATHPPVKDIEIQFEFIRTKRQTYAESFLFRLGPVGHDSPVNTTRNTNKHGSIGAPEACLSQLPARLLPFSPGRKCLPFDRYSSAGSGRYHFGSLCSHQWLGRWYSIRFRESRLATHELLRSIRPIAHAPFAQGLD
jgi:hypothetical protein